ncbi:MAG: hypothetical protein O6761_08730 [Thaumarchaeota archaeon]|nr:hypothetical protein [Nitrososphaerota archaeon]
MAGENTAIWRATVAQGATEASALAANKILFNSSPELETGSFVLGTEVNYRNATPENPRVAGQINEVQDMGLQGIDIQLTTQIRETSSTIKDLTHLTTWLKENKTEQTLFSKGIFGLRMDDMPQFNITPTATYGFILAQARIHRNAEFTEKAEAIITLRFSGDPAGLGV